MDRRLLIVNADDFGQGHGVNRGVFRAFEDGILTSASAMTRWPAVRGAASYARDHPSLSVGLHVDLGEWAIRQGEWVPLYEVVPIEHDAILDEVLRQVSAFRGLFGRDPTHIDSHQHRHREEPVLSAVRAVADSLGVPLRDHSTVRAVADSLGVPLRDHSTVRAVADSLGVPLRDHSTVWYCGSFYGQTGEGESRPDWITVDALVALIRACGPGVTELACHPGDGSDPDIPTMYKTERALEVAALCHTSARSAIEEAGITLVSYLDLGGVVSGHRAPGGDTAGS
jgi:predicted glycoside hydrolase/deacetylase ChbG (UPF0249 family)